MLLSERGDSFISEKLDHIEYLIKKVKRFTLHLSNGHATGYFIMTYFPHFPNYQAPIFNLGVIEGNPRDKSTWQQLVNFGQSYVSLLDIVTLNEWHNYHSVYYANRDELFYYDIPIGIL